MSQDDSLSTAYNDDIRPFIDVIDKLRSLGLEQEMSLPNVVVVGDQSSGKSSIIEAISGINLPRGKGIVTRCPLELQLKRVHESSWKAILSYTSKENNKLENIITDPNEVGDRIREAQDLMCESSKGVSDKLITLRVESPSKSAPDLTLIDLPGIARIALDGQPANICNQIKDIIMKYVKNKKSVILCVVSANLDAAVNESIKISKEVDSEGKRTFGVITKPDSADDAQKEEVMCLLNNERIYLEKGYNMVKCRSQKELEEKLSLKMSLEREEEFFKNDKVYRKIDKDQLGTMNLAKKITEQLVDVIKATLPGLKDKVHNFLMETREKYSRLPLEIPSELQAKNIYLLSNIMKINTEISDCINTGRFFSSKMNLFYEWREQFNKLKMKIDSMRDGAMDKRFSLLNLEKEISMQRGKEICGFLNFTLFENMMKDFIISYLPEAESMLHTMMKCTDKIINQIVCKHFTHLPAVEMGLKEIYHAELDKSHSKAKDRLTDLFKEECLIFTLDMIFEREMNIMKEEEDRMKQAMDPGVKAIKSYDKDNFKKNAERLKRLIVCYLKIVHVRLADTIPMSVRQILHIELCENLQIKFIEYCATADVATIVSENSRTQIERKKLTEKLKRLQSAKDELAKI